VDISALDGIELSKLCNSRVAGLMKAVAKDEVFAALSSMKPFKASSMDGFQPFFFKTYWDVVGEDI
jgi:hypothetical protein